MRTGGRSRGTEAGGLGEAAVAAHRAGRLAEAEARYRRALDAVPTDPELCHLAALLAYQRGRIEEALARFARAVALAPGVARYHSNLASAFLAGGRPAEAAESCRRALARRPDYAEAYSNLGVALAALGRLDEATAALRRALRLKPGWATAHNNLGNVLKDRGDLGGACAAYRAAIAAEPTYADAQCNLAVALTALGRLDEAEAAARRAVTLAPRHPGAHDNLGAILRFQGRLDQALAAFRSALAIDPDHVAALRNASEIAPLDPDDPAVRRLDRRAPGLGPRDRSAAHFTLARVFDRAGEPARAFAHWRAGNAARAQEARRLGRGFDRDAHRRTVDALIAAFPPEALPVPGGEPDPRPVLIVGMPRSGTSLVEQMLASHPGVFGAGERAEIGEIAARLAADPVVRYPDGLAALAPTRATSLGADYVRRLAAEAGGAARITDKMPVNFRHLGLIARILPAARIVHCRRHPLDVCLSCYSQDFTVGNEFSDDLADLAAFYADYHRLMAHWRSVLPLSMLELDYEALIADPEGEVRRLLTFLGLPWDSRCLAFHETRRPVRTASNVQVRKPLYASAVGRWRAYERELAPLAEALVAAGVPL